MKNKIISGAITGAALGLFLVVTRDWSTWLVFARVVLIVAVVQGTAGYFLPKIADRRNQ